MGQSGDKQGEDHSVALCLLLSLEKKFVFAVCKPSCGCIVWVHLSALHRDRLAFSCLLVFPA